MTYPQLLKVVGAMLMQDAFEFVWASIEVFAPIYDLICEMMSQCGLVFARHEEEWRIVMYEEREAIDEARAALERWTKPPEPQQE